MSDANLKLIKNILIVGMHTQENEIFRSIKNYGFTYKHYPKKSSKEIPIADGCIICISQCSHGLRHEVKKMYEKLDLPLIETSTSGGFSSVKEVFERTFVFPHRKYFQGLASRLQMFILISEFYPKGKFRVVQLREKLLLYGTKNAYNSSYNFIKGLSYKGYLDLRELYDYHFIGWDQSIVNELKACGYDASSKLSTKFKQPKQPKQPELPPSPKSEKKNPIDDIVLDELVKLDKEVNHLNEVVKHLNANIIGLKRSTEKNNAEIAYKDFSDRLLKTCTDALERNGILNQIPALLKKMDTRELCTFMQMFELAIKMQKGQE